MVDQLENIRNAIETAINQLESENLEERVQDGSLAAELHAFYNQVGLKEKWLQPEYATPLSRQDRVNQLKNIEAAKDVAQYWLKVVYSLEAANPAVVLEAMARAVDYEANRGYSHLEACADSQHEQWKRFVEQNQNERITPGHAKFREANYRQYNTRYQDLAEKEKDQDRLVVSVVTKRILEGRLS